MLARFLFLFAMVGALSCPAQAEDDINTTDVSIIARLRAGPGFCITSDGQPATLALSFDAGYRSFDGFGVIATGTDLFSSSTIVESSSAFFLGAAPSYTFDHGDLSLSFGIAIGYMHYSHTHPDFGIDVTQNRLAFAPLIQGDYQVTRDLFVNLALTFFVQTGDNGALVFEPAAGVGWRF